MLSICATILHQISYVPVSVSAAQNCGAPANRNDILRVFMVLSARRKRRRKKAAFVGTDGGEDDDGDVSDDENGRSVADHGSVTGPLVIPMNTADGSKLCMEYDPKEACFQRHVKRGLHVTIHEVLLQRLKTSASPFPPRMG